MRPRLSALTDLPPDIMRPTYDRMAHGFGILHLGLGAFHRSHQAVYTDDALASEGGDWRIRGANLRSHHVPDALNAQSGLYTVLERSARDLPRIIGAHGPAIGGNLSEILRVASDPAIRILSLTVSEKAYGINREAMDVDPTHPAVITDLSYPETPTGILGLITIALARRREAGMAPFTVLSCDNLPDNGALLQAGVLGFARRLDSGLAGWIEDCVAFPSTMVDRITPAVTETTRNDVEDLINHIDLACVETEPFRQWVIEDYFPQGRPAWEAGGAEFVRDVSVYEAMKLRMLNGSHSLMAYTGQLLGMKYVRDVVNDELTAEMARRFLRAAGSTLPEGRGADPGAYAEALMLRFANPAIAHRTSQIAVDGSEKLPQRWFTPAILMLESGQDARVYAFATAVWLAWLAEKEGKNELPDDPRGSELSDLVRKAGTSSIELVRNVLSLSGLAVGVIGQHNKFISQVGHILNDIRRIGLRITLRAELQA